MLNDDLRTNRGMPQRRRCSRSFSIVERLLYDVAMKRVTQSSWFVFLSIIAVCVSTASGQAPSARPPIVGYLAPSQLPDVIRVASCAGCTT